MPASLQQLGSTAWLAAYFCSSDDVWQDDPAGAKRELRPAYVVLGKLGETTHFSSLTHALAHALYDQGRYGEAEQLPVECEAASRPNDAHSESYGARSGARRSRAA